MGSLNAMNFYFYIRSLDPAVPIRRDREYARYPFKSCGLPAGRLYSEFFILFASLTLWATQYGLSNYQICVYGNGFIVVGIDSVIAAFAKDIETVVLHVFDKIKLSIWATQVFEMST